MNKDLIAGLSLGQSGIEAVICDSQFNVLHSVSRPYSGKVGKESLASKMSKAVTSLPDFHLSYALGISLPAVFKQDNKTVLSSNLEDIDGVDMYQLLSKKIDLPMYFSRRSYCYLLAEQAFGAAENVKNGVLVEIGRDISMSLLVNGKIYKGSGNSAGRISEMIVDITREKRNSGGSFGSMASGESIANLTGQSIYEILKRNPKSEIVTKQILKDLKESLMTGLFNIKLLLDPEVFIITGDILENYSLFHGALRDLNVPIVKSSIGKQGPALGAAITAYNHFKRRKP